MRLADLAAPVALACVLLASPAHTADTTAPGYRPLQFEAPAAGTYELPPLGPAASGALLDEDARAVELHDMLGGEVAVLSFVYTTCRESGGCPLASFVLAGVQARLLERPEIRDRVRFVTVSFDPEHDGPERMRRYAARLRKAPMDWRFLTARTESELAPILAAYGQTVRKDYDAAGKYLGTISHMLRVYLIDRRKRIRNVYSTSFLHADTLIADIETLLIEERGRARDPRDTSEAQRTDGAERTDVPSLGLPPLPASRDGGATRAKTALGRKLFFDRRLSANDTFSCATCHVPTQGFTHNEMATAVGIEGRTVKRNAPTLYNVAYAPVLFHDGRVKTLEEQAWGPLLAHNEMGNTSPEAVAQELRSLSDYDGLFEQAFAGAGPDRETIGAALASYQRTLLAAASPFDRWRFGADEDALSDTAKRGFELFTGKAGCASCHVIASDHALFSDYDFHDTGVGSRSERLAKERHIEIVPGVALDMAHVDMNAARDAMRDEGRFEVTRAATDRWKYRTPTLRNVALTAPYMHDGSLPTLASVVDYYDAGGERHDLLDPRIHRLGLSHAEKDTLVAFLESLTGDTTLVVNDALSAPVGNPN